MKTLSKIFLIILPLVLFGKEVTVSQLFSVQTVKVKKELRSERIKNYGYVVVDQARKYDISPRFGGYVVTLYANTLYKKVKRGEPLMEVYAPEVLKAKDEYLNSIGYAQQRSSQGMLKSAKLKLQLLGVDDKEIHEVFSKRKVSPNTTIYSPVNGYVFMQNIDQGSAFNAKQKLFKIVNLDKVWVEAKVFEKQRERLSLTTHYELRFKGLNKVYTTNKKFLYPELDPKLATLTLRLPVDNKDHQLFPGMYASVTAFKAEKEVLVLPSTAVIRKHGKFYVFGAGEYEGEYEPREVDVEVLNEHTYAVVRGLQEGDEVVNNALFMMDSDAQINGLY